MSTTERSESGSRIDRAIGQRVAELRGKASQADIATRVREMGGEMKQAYLSALERGERRWNSESLYMVASALGVRMADLMPDAAVATLPGQTMVAVDQHELTLLMVRRTRGAKAAVMLLLPEIPD